MTSKVEPLPLRVHTSWPCFEFPAESVSGEVSTQLYETHIEGTPSGYRAFAEKFALYMNVGYQVFSLVVAMSASGRLELADLRARQTASCELQPLAFALKTPAVSSQFHSFPEP